MEVGKNFETLPNHFMKFAKYTFLVAGIYGLVALVPQYFLADKIGRDFPPAITHPEYYHGFVGVALAWQIAFLIISRNPARYRLMMLPAILEKAAFRRRCSFFRINFRPHYSARV